MTISFMTTKTNYRPKKKKLHQRNLRYNKKLKIKIKISQAINTPYNNPF